MEIRNILKDIKDPLELHRDKRGTIADIFYDEIIKHVAIIQSKKGEIRGNHYHKDAQQHMLMTKGSLEYWYKHLGSDEPAKYVIAREYDLVTTPPNEIHALRILEENEFIVFSEGKRGGKDYESDTFRVENSIIPK